MRTWFSFLVLAASCGCHGGTRSVPLLSTASPAADGGGSAASAGRGVAAPPAAEMDAGASGAGGRGRANATPVAAAAVSGAGAHAGAGAGAAGTAGAAAIGGSGGTAGAADTRPLPAIAFAGLVSALELAPVRLAANGLYPAKVTIGSGGVDNLFTGGTLLASNAETQALRASVQHADLRIIFTICEGLYRIVAKRSAGIQALADLRGKRISVLSGTSSHYFLIKMLEVAQLTEQDVVVVNGMPGAGTLTTDAATIWEPGIQYVADALKDDAIEFQKDAQDHEVYRELFNLHATAQSLSDPESRRAIVAFVRALIQASEQIRNDPTPAWKLSTGPTGASQDVLQRSWTYERFAGGLVSDLLDVLEQEEVWRARIDGRSPRAREQLQTLIDGSIVDEAAM